MGTDFNYRPHLFCIWWLAAKATFQETARFMGERRFCKEAALQNVKFMMHLTTKSIKMLNGTFP